MPCIYEKACLHREGETHARKKQHRKKMQSKALAGREERQGQREGEDRGRAYPDLVSRSRPTSRAGSEDGGRAETEISKRNPRVWHYTHMIQKQKTKPDQVSGEPAAC